MRPFKSMLLTAAALTAMVSSSFAMSTIFDWQGQGRSEVFTIPKKQGSWRAAWDCQTRSNATIALLNADSGVAVDFLGASYRGERLISKVGRFQLDSRDSFCRVTVTTLD